MRSPFSLLCRGPAIPDPQLRCLRLPAERRKGICRGAAHVRVAVFDRDFEGLKCALVANLAESVGRSPTDAPTRVFEGGYERVAGARIPDLAESVGRSLADIHRWASESGHQGPYGIAVANLAQGFGGGSTHADVVVFQSVDEGLDEARITDLTKSNRGVPAYAPELLILQRSDQPRAVSLARQLVDVWRSK